ncbi:MAG TPA: hypothetical protein VMS31_17805 [Pyrinomonadaceae bacterium]|nr:hypothetical protein [Pyrinomonadaceae bacterium]
MTNQDQVSRFLIALLLTGLIAGGACQTYTTTMKQSVARANETSAIAILRSIALAQQTYSLSNSGKYGTFQQLVEGGYLDSSINPASPEVKDYLLSMEVGDKQGLEFYSCKADPKGGEMAGRHFYIDSTSRELHVNPTQPATASDPTYQP